MALAGGEGMAKVAAAVDERIYEIKKWLGVNEAAEGEQTLKLGEASKMQNFRVTAGGALKKRAGSANVAGLLSEYVIAVDEVPETLITEENESTVELLMYPSMEIDSVGGIVLTGEAVSVLFATSEEYIGYYYKSAHGGIFRFSGVTRVEGGY